MLAVTLKQFVCITTEEVQVFVSTESLGINSVPLDKKQSQASQGEFRLFIHCSLIVPKNSSSSRNPYQRSAAAAHLKG